MRYDVAIVGGGPAGAAAALRLAREGATVCIIERAAFPRTKACGEYLSAGTVRMLYDIGVGPQLAPHASVLQGIRLSGSGTGAHLRFSAPAWSVPRSVLDAALLDAAMEAGARRIIARAERFMHRSDGVRVQHRTGDRVEELDANVLIGADGIHSTVARHYGLAAPVRGRRRFALGGHYTQLRGLDGCVEMFVAGGGYFAINPLSATRANVMLVVDELDLRASRADVDAFMRERVTTLTSGRIRFEDARIEGKRIAIGPLSYRARRYSAPRVLLAGDAAHFLDPFTGQGVYLALRSAQLASRAVIRTLAEDIPEPRAWREYERQLRHEIARRRRLSAIVALLVRVPAIAKNAAALLERKPDAFRPLLDAVTR